MPKPGQPYKLWIEGFKGLFAALFHLLELLLYAATIMAALLFSLALFCFLFAIWIFGIKVSRDLPISIVSWFVQ